MRSLGLIPLLLLLAGAGDAPDSVVVKTGELPEGWSFVKSVYSKSLDAADLYANYDVTYAQYAGAPLVEKKFQSFAAPADRGTVYYLRFASDAEARQVEDYAKGIIWRGESPQPEPTERIFTVGTTVVIVSSADAQVAEQLEKLVRR